MDATTGGFVNPPPCDDTSVLTMPLTIEQPAQLWVAGAGTLVRHSGEGNIGARLRVSLRQGDVILASRFSPTHTVAVGEAEAVELNGVLLDLSHQEPFLAVPGLYTLELTILVDGFCNGFQQFSAISLDVMGHGVAP